MVKGLFLVLLVAFYSFSCKRNNFDSEVSAICNCYDQIHNESVMSSNQVELKEKIKICNNMLTSKLNSLGDNEKDKQSFMKDFRACQEN